MSGQESNINSENVAAGHNSCGVTGHCPSPLEKRISPHVLRHTCTLNILKATGDIRKVALWLGHESIQTTEDYLRVDVTERIGVLESVTPEAITF